MGAATVIKLSDRAPRVRKRRYNDPLESPLVRATRKLIKKATATAVEKHQNTHSTEEALVAGAYASGLADALVLLEWVAVELAKKPQP
jgi:hypothetical protein